MVSRTERNNGNTEAGSAGFRNTYQITAMAIGLPPTYRYQINMEGASKEAALVLAADAFSGCYWPMAYSNAEQLTARTSGNLFWEEGQVQVVWQAGQLVVTSSSTHRFFWDGGQNKRNVVAFCRSVDALRAQAPWAHWALQYGALAAGFTAAPSPPPPYEPLHQGVHSIFSFFLPRKHYWATLLLATCNLLAFGVMLSYGINPLFSTPIILLDWGANFYPAVVEGEWWRLLSGCFLHVNAIHLLGNLSALIFIGFVVEPLLGSFRFLTFYLMLCILASLASIYWRPTLVSAGASGAIFGLCGLLVVLLMTHIIGPKSRRPLLLVTLVFIAITLVSGLVISHIDNAAHVGGLLAGCTMGLFFLPHIKITPKAGKGYALAAAGILLISIVNFWNIHPSFKGFRKYAASWQLFRGISPDIVRPVLPAYYHSLPPSLGRYRQRIKDAAIVESMALEVYQTREYAPVEILMYQIKGRGIYYWKQIIWRLKGLDSLSLPEMYHQKNQILIHYCRLRISGYNLMYKTLKEHTGRYRDSLQFYHKTVAALMNDLK